MTYQEFESLLTKLCEEIPEALYRDLNGGVLLDPACKLHPASLKRDLWILGEYHHEKVFGRYIVIYYGSFMKVCGSYGQEGLKLRLYKTLRHEFLHHLESLAGFRDLEAQDALFLNRYRASRSEGRPAVHTPDRPYMIKKTSECR